MILLNPTSKLLILNMNKSAHFFDKFSLSKWNINVKPESCIIQHDT